jgi:hypothetical protein
MSEKKNSAFFQEFGVSFILAAGFGSFQKLTFLCFYSELHTKKNYFDYEPKSF